MKGYIYTMFQGADPALGWKMTDPIYTKVPTLGSCVPNIRRVVEQGDYIFSISGRVKNINQYLVGCFAVDEKINQLAAYKKFPENRMKMNKDGGLTGNIIIDAKGNHLPIDYHANHEKRIENYIIGKDPIIMQTEQEVERSRQETIYILNNIFNKKEDAIHKIIGRWRKLDQSQINDLVGWMNNIKR